MVIASILGIPASVIDVTIQDGFPTVKARPKSEPGQEEANCGLRERHFDSLQRRFTLPNAVDEDHVTAQYDLSVLTLALPKANED